MTNEQQSSDYVTLMGKARVEVDGKDGTLISFSKTVLTSLPVPKP